MATNFYLRELTKVIGRDIGLPIGNIRKGIFITNAVLCMKPGAMNAPHPSACVKNCGDRSLKPLIDLIRPKAIVTLGVVPTMSVLGLYANLDPELAVLRRSALRDVFSKVPINLNSCRPRLFPMYHPSRLGQMGRERAEPSGSNGWELMKSDRLQMSAIVNLVR